MTRRRALFLDRDGVINTDDGYIGSIGRFRFMPDLFPFLKAARDRGYLLCVITNQSGVARGLFSEKDYNDLTAHMLAMLAREGVTIDLTLACFYHPNGQRPELTRESFWRKPNPGMILEAARRLHADPARSVFIGDHERDMVAAKNAHVGTCLWLTRDIRVELEGVRIVPDHAHALVHLP